MTTSSSNRKSYDNTLLSPLMVVLIGALLIAVQASANQYDIDKEHTEVGFEISHLVISKVRGRFDKFQGAVTIEKGVLKQISGTVEASSINTNHEKRDKHLRSADFFDVEKNPKLSFEAKDLSIKKGETKTVKGSLSIHGVSRQEDIELSFVGETKDPWGTEKAVVNAKAKINRKNYGLTWNQALEAGGVMVGEEVNITVLAQANKK